MTITTGAFVEGPFTVLIGGVRYLPSGIFQSRHATQRKDSMQAKRFKTGDPHPVHNLTAFVEYDEQGKEWWTSVYEDSEAPYRLARENAQLRGCNSGASPDTLNIHDPHQA